MRRARAGRYAPRRGPCSSRLCWEARRAPGGRSPPEPTRERVGSTRRSATVTISRAGGEERSLHASSERKPPVPTISREPQIRPPSENARPQSRGRGAAPARDQPARAYPPWTARTTSTVWSLCELGPSPVRPANHLAVDRDRDPAAARRSDARLLHRVATVAPSGSSAGRPLSSTFIAAPPCRSEPTASPGRSRPRTARGGRPPPPAAAVAAPAARRPPRPSAGASRMPFR